MGAKTVETIEEAREHFIENHSDPVWCVRGDGSSVLARTFIEARDFFVSEIRG